MSDNAPDDAPLTPRHDQSPAFLRGDLTRGPIFKTLVAFSIPTLISNLLQTLNGTINSIWVGRLLGESALAATANANNIMFLLFAAVFGFGMATTVRVGQYFGARELDRARQTFGAGVGFCSAMAIIIGILGSSLAPQLLHVLATPEASRAEALSYLRVNFLTMPLGSLSLMLGMGLRGVGDSKTPMRAMMLTVALDVCLNPLLIRGFGPLPSLGIAGSAMATAFANLAGSAAMVAALYRQDNPLRLRGRELRYLIPGRAEIAYVVTKGLPMGTQMLIVSAAGVILIGLVNREGLEATAAYGASLQLWGFLQMPAFSINSAVSAMVAQNVGAGTHDRVGPITKTGIIACLMITISMTALLLLFDRQLLGLFLHGVSPARTIASHILLIATWSFVLQGVSMVMTGTMRGYGEVVLPMLGLFVALYPVRLGFYFIARHYIGGDAVWWAFPVGSTMTLLMTTLIYRHGKWRKARVPAKT